MRYLSKYKGFKNISEDIDFIGEKNMRFFNLTKEELEDYLLPLSDKIYVRVSVFDEKFHNPYISIWIHDKLGECVNDINSLKDKLSSRGMIVEEETRPIGDKINVVTSVLIVKNRKVSGYDFIKKGEEMK